VSDAVTHPSPEVLVDHHENMLPAVQALWVNDHVAECAECRDFLDALGEVQDALRDAGASSTPMPATVAAGIEAALADEAHHRATVVPIRPAGTRQSDADRSADQSSVVRHRRRSRLLLVAAGTVAVLAIGGVVTRSQLSRDNGGSSASRVSASNKTESNGRAGSAAGGADTPDKLGTSRTTTSSPPAFSINRQNFEGVVPLAISTGGAVHGVNSACLAKAVPRYQSGSWISMRVTWSGKPAWLLVNPSRTEGYVVDCGASPRVFYHHAF
jgi:negative regulator of sigma E activity